MGDGGKGVARECECGERKAQSAAAARGWQGQQRQPLVPPSAAQRSQADASSVAPPARRWLFCRDLLGGPSTQSPSRRARTSGASSSGQSTDRSRASRRSSPPWRTLRPGWPHLLLPWVRLVEHVWVSGFEGRRRRLGLRGVRVGACPAAAVARRLSHHAATARAVGIDRFGNKKLCPPPPASPPTSASLLLPTRAQSKPLSFSFLRWAMAWVKAFDQPAPATGASDALDDLEVRGRGWVPAAAPSLAAWRQWRWRQAHGFGCWLWQGMSARRQGACAVSRPARVGCARWCRRRRRRTLPQTTQRPPQDSHVNLARPCCNLSRSASAGRSCRLAAPLCAGTHAQA